MSKNFVIQSVVNPEAFWREGEGWVTDYHCATLFSYQDREHMSLPSQGAWETIGKVSDSRLVGA